MLAHLDLSRYAGQFVWLEMNFDKPQNQDFFSRFEASATPTFYVIGADGNVLADQPGAMSEPELRAFLDRGMSLAQNRQSPADAALVHADALLSTKSPQAAAAYEEVLRQAPPDWPRRELAQYSLVTALQLNEQHQQCAETAAREAAVMKHDNTFASTVASGMWCLVQSDTTAAWRPAAADKLVPLANSALASPETVRDERNELYRTLMYLDISRNDTTHAASLEDKWLAELDQVKPADDEERSAVDIARVEAISIYGDPERVLPALRISEQAMPHNYNASLRVAQMEKAEKHYDAAIAACERGLARDPGALGRSWLLQTKADALKQQGKSAEARQALQQALAAAQEIPMRQSRENNLKKIKQALGGE
ncbi:MAG: thioredoxin family protein [Acidobacteria bacterium]|nr:thioredoxin family protein [Acidobacteriota bacterium]